VLVWDFDAPGAAPRDLAKAVLAETGRIVTVGVLCGGITALVSARIIRASLFGIGPSDPLAS
jgi:hypothetical protein